MKPKTARDTAGEPGVRWGVAGPGGIAVRFADSGSHRFTQQNGTIR